MILHKGTQITCYNVIPEYLKVREMAVMGDLIRTAFSKTGIYPINRNVFSEEDFAPSMASSSSAHVPASFPDDVPSSDMAIPTDAESEEDSDFENEDLDMESSDLGEWIANQAATDNLDPFSQADDLELEFPESDTETPQEAQECVAHTTCSSATIATLMDISNLAYHCCTVPFEVDKQKSPEELVNKVQELRQQLCAVYDAFWMQEASTRAANAHCTIVKHALTDCRTQVQNLSKMKERGSSKIKVRFLTGEGLWEVFEAEDVKRQELEIENAEKEAQKLAELEARNAHIADDAASKVFDHALTSYKKKDEFLSIAGVLKISDKGTIPNLLNCICQHMELHPELQENPHFAGLFHTSGSRGRHNPAIGSSSSQRSAPQTEDHMASLAVPEASTGAFQPGIQVNAPGVMYYPPTILNYTNPYAIPYHNVPQPSPNYYDTNY